MDKKQIIKPISQESQSLDVVGNKFSKKIIKELIACSQKNNCPIDIEQIKIFKDNDFVFAAGFNSSISKFDKNIENGKPIFVFYIGTLENQILKRKSCSALIKNELIIEVPQNKGPVRRYRFGNITVEVWETDHGSYGFRVLVDGIVLVKGMVDFG